MPRGRSSGRRCRSPALCGARCARTHARTHAPGHHRQRAGAHRKAVAPVLVDFALLEFHIVGLCAPRPFVTGNEARARVHACHMPPWPSAPRRAACALPHRTRSMTTTQRHRPLSSGRGPSATASPRGGRHEARAVAATARSLALTIVVSVAVAVVVHSRGRQLQPRRRGAELPPDVQQRRLAVQRRRAGTASACGWLGRGRLAVQRCCGCSSGPERVLRLAMASWWRSALKQNRRFSAAVRAPQSAWRCSDAQGGIF